MAYFLGLDTGTSGTKAVIADENGVIRATFTEEYPLSTPKPQWAEQHPDDDWWRAAQVAIAGVLAKAELRGEDITGVGLTGQMHGSVFLDRNGKVLRPALLWCDSRTGAECAEITEAIGGPEKLYATIGQPVFTSFTAPKIVWLKKHEPALYEQVAKVLLPKDYIRYKLTGEFATEVSDASGTSLLNVRLRDWSDAMLSALDIPREWLPKVYESPEVSGAISEEAATLTGLKAGTPVVGGGSDQAAGAVGCGVVEAGKISMSLGTSGVVFAHLDETFFAPEKIQTFCHAVPGKWHLMGCILSAAGSFEWYRDTFEPQASYDAITERAANAPAGCEGLLFLPYLAGERNPYFDPEARGVFFGATLRSQQSWFARAVLEGVAYAINDLFQLVGDAGITVDEVRAIGGGVRSALWRQIVSDVACQSLWQVNVEEGPAYGAAVLAMVGTGAYGSVPEACSATIRTTTETKPDSERGAVYAQYYPLYRKLYPLLKDSFAEAALINR
ncbi:MAG: xylulokinase [Armatimonadaceae bacterium]